MHRTDLGPCTSQKCVKESYIKVSREAQAVEQMWFKLTMKSMWKWVGK